MRAIVVDPPKVGARFAEVPVPPLGPGEVRVVVRECGVCGTDRDIVAGAYGTPPAGRSALVLGHENLGQVEEVGASVDQFRVGDWVVASVRRGCGACRFCRSGKADCCSTGRFTERGIRGADGYFAEQYVESSPNLFAIPAALRSIAVLLEPLSVVEKAIRVGLQVLARREPTQGFPAPSRPPVLVAGTGAVGMLAVFALRIEGHPVTAIDRHGEGTEAAQLLAGIGARHVNAESGMAGIGRERFDLVIEATGSLALDAALLRVVGPNGVLVLTGIPGPQPKVAPEGDGTAIRTLVLENQAIVGSVNAERQDFEAGIRHLAAFQDQFPGPISKVITSRRSWSEFEEVLSAKQSIKSVLVVGDTGRN
jgi:glucose 1-dehydrogenase